MWEHANDHDLIISLLDGHAEAAEIALAQEPGVVSARLVAQRVADQDASDRDDRDQAAARVADDLEKWHRSDPGFTVDGSAPPRTPRLQQS